MFSTLIAILILGGIIGVAVGVPLAKRKNNQNDTAASSSSGASSGGGKGSGNPSTGSDPSVFPKDPNLHQSFYGMAYTPDGSQLPNCGNSLGECPPSFLTNSLHSSYFLDAVIKDIQVNVFKLFSVVFLC